MRWLIAGATAAALLAGWRSQAVQPAQSSFTPEVEEFVRIYLKEGGDKLTNWVQGDTTSRPAEALKAFKPADGLTMDLVASEPVIRQPIDLHFDDRGRLWVVQYLQYPFPAGVTINSYDQYLRARYNLVPSPPPNHVRGADKITVLEDTNGDGVFDLHKDVITGLNITTSVLTGRGGVWVMNPPYLLFYRDRTGDGLPDGDPEVRLQGFGLEDTHSLANSLTWGPDGWLYGVHGSTSTARVRGIAFLGQAVWRYHPETDAFELFAEGGGNPWTLSFDRSGRPFSGDNGGNSRGFHWVQGGRYQKNWPKHGPFTRPHSYGYIPHMPHEGYPARFAMTFVVYEEGRLPGYEGQLISGMALTSRMQASRLVPDGSTFKTIDSDAVATTPDRSFRPVDTAVGPDGALYIADWCDIRMDHTDPRDTWDKSCGRIWRLRGRDYRSVAAFDLAKRSSEDLVALLDDGRKWYREQARRVLGERRDPSLVPGLRQRVRDGRGQVALEALWTSNLISGVDSAFALELLDHADAPVRAWALRLSNQSGSMTRPLIQKLTRLARQESAAEVRSELANTAAHLEPHDAIAVLNELVRRREDVADPHIPMRLWWALERAMTTDADAVLDWLGSSAIWDAPLFTDHLAGRIARRLAADRGETHSFTRIDPDRNWKAYAQHPRSQMPGGKGDYTEWQTNYTPDISDRNLTRLARLLELDPAGRHRERLLAGTRAGLEQGPPVDRVPGRLSTLIARWWTDRTRSDDLVRVAARLKHADAVEALERTGEPGSPGTGNPRATTTIASESGLDAFLTHCAPCHQSDGSGMERLAPPLRNSKWVVGREEPLVGIALNGLTGNLVMPAMGTLDDRQLAAILTYIRRAWGHQAGSISPDTVARIRAASAGRKTPWTVNELSVLRIRQ
jgi:putative membrane-bound dehydrogenase-like protein